MQIVGVTAQNGNEKQEKTLQDLKDSLRESILTMTTDAMDELTEEEERQLNNRIMMKLKMGKRLSAKEMEYLRRKNPELYRTAKRIELQRDMLKEQLRHCKSKEEANMIYAHFMQGVDKDPAKEYMQAAFSEEMKEFQKTKEYAKLPDTIEEAKKKKKAHNSAESKNENEKDEEEKWQPLPSGNYNAQLEDGAAGISEAGFMDVAG